MFKLSSTFHRSSDGISTVCSTPGQVSSQTGYVGRASILFRQIDLWRILVDFKGCREVLDLDRVVEILAAAAAHEVEILLKTASHEKFRAKDLGMDDIADTAERLHERLIEVYTVDFALELLALGIDARRVYCQFCLH